MHIDLNSCFASCEQQANPLLRGRPIAVAAYPTGNGCILAPSIEAKTFGVKTGMRVKEGLALCPQLIILPSDPVKYRAIHILFMKVFRSYSAMVVPKSIDEAVIDFGQSPYFNRGLENIGLEIKQRVKEEVGDWIRCNVGISTNRFLAKLAASLHKPDGLDVINHQNLIKTYQSIKLTDLNGIASRLEVRLNAQGIFTPLEFFQASEEALRHQVFRSIVGKHWFYRLHGFEVDEVEFGRKSIGHSYALQKQTADRKELSILLIKLTEKVGRRLRQAGCSARGIYLYLNYTDGTSWNQSKTLETELYASSDIYLAVQRLLGVSPLKRIRTIAVGCFKLKTTNQAEQLSLFPLKNRQIADAMDQVNNRFGEFTVVPALMMDMANTILDRIAFGKVRDLEKVG